MTTQNFGPYLNGMEDRGILRLRNIGKAYGSQARPISVLKDVSLTLAAGDFCAVLGPSGSGKSTLLNIIGMLEQPDVGTVEIDRQPVDFSSAYRMAWMRNRLLGFVFQAFHLLPRLTALQNVALPLLYRGIGREDRSRRAFAMLDRVGLADRTAHLPGELSGGQCQRVALARALVGEAKLILADEPTGSLDSATALEVIDLLQSVSRDDGVTIVMVTHDQGLAAKCDRRIEFLDGRVVADSRAG